MAELTLYSAPICPFAQRSRLALAEKGLTYDLVEIDLDHTPEWYREISPYAKVPLLVDGATRVWESSIINEYLDEAFPEPALMPQTPAQRALARIWIDYANTQFLPWFYKLLLEQRPDRQQRWSGRLIESLRYIEAEAWGRKDTGPYWLGDRLSLVDLAFYPFFERFPVLEHYRGFGTPAELSRLRRWLTTMAQRPNVRAQSGTADFYIAGYARYANNTAQGALAQELREELASS